MGGVGVGGTPATGVKWLGREADHSPSSKASVKLSEIVHSGPHALLWRVFKNKKLPM